VKSSSRCAARLLQRKVDGVKAVVTISSSVAQMGRVSAVARALDAPLTPFDRFQFAYKVSKTGLNQGALTFPHVLRHTPGSPRCVPGMVADAG